MGSHFLARVLYLRGDIDTKSNVSFDFNEGAYFIPGSIISSIIKSILFFNVILTKTSWVDRGLLDNFWSGTL